MSVVIGIDGGPTKSAWVRVVDGAPAGWAHEDNEIVRERLRCDDHLAGDHLVYEAMQVHGMHTTQETMDTAFWNGMFVASFDGPATGIRNSEVRGHICRDMKANDAAIRRAVIARYGGAEIAIGGIPCATCSGSGSVRGRVPCVQADCDKGFVPGNRGPKKCHFCHGKATIAGYQECQSCKGSRWEHPRGVLASFNGPHGFSALAVALTWLDKYAAPVAAQEQR